MLNVQVRICGMREVSGRIELTAWPFWNEGSMNGARGKFDGYPARSPVVDGSVTGGGAGAVAIGKPVGDEARPETGREIDAARRADHGLGVRLVGHTEPRAETAIPSVGERARTRSARAGSGVQQRTGPSARLRVRNERG